MDYAIHLFAIPIPLLPLIVTFILVPFVGAIARSLLGFWRLKYSGTAKIPLKDGLDIVHEGPKAEVDLVAVHGLGANPNYAWTANVGNKDRFGWLEHLLPQDVPNTRIMTFSFQSSWLLDAPKTRTTHCAAALLNAVHNKRRETETTERPLIFMGHSFGGNLIERAIVNAHLDEERKDIAMATAGVLFFGTPHRGSKDASWGRIIAELGSYAGFGSHDGIIRDLEEESSTQMDLLHDFSVWVRRMSVDVVCFFELRETDYGRKVSLPGIRRKIVVTESSACIDGCAKISLDVDHLCLNQFKGPDDPSYKKARPEIKKMVDEASAKIRRRLSSHPVVCDDEQIRATSNSGEKLECLHALLLAESEVILENLRRTKGERVDGTCEWVLVNAQYAEWLAAEKSQLLRLTGSPGIGKSMIATFLVDELRSKAQYSGSTLFAFFFCDNKDERQRTAAAVLRSLLVQLLRQQPLFFKYVQPEYEKYGKDKFESVFCMDFGALWIVFEAILRDPMKQSIFVLIDAVDECDEESKTNLVKVIHDFFDPESRKNKGKPSSPAQLVKIIIAHRPEPSMEKGFRNGTQPLIVDSGLINHDLSKFILEKTTKLQDDLDLDSEKTGKIRDALERKAEGTFLWVSLVLGDMDKRDTQGNITDLLDTLPSGLPETYTRLLRKIKSAHEDVASFILRTVFIARRPLTIDELATVCLLELGRYGKTTAPTGRDLNEWKREYRCCGAFLKLDEENQTIHLVHQSAKDFLQDLSMHEELVRFYPEPSVSDLRMLEICWEYLSMKEFEGGVIIEEWDDFKEYSFLSYAGREWKDHAVAAYPAWLDQSRMDKRILDKLPTLRDAWLLLAARVGQALSVLQLLDRGACIDSKDKFGRTPLSEAADNGHETVVKVLLDKGAGVDLKDRFGQTPLSRAAENGHGAVVKLLSNTGTDVGLLFNEGADVNSKDEYGRTPLSVAVSKGDETIVKLLINMGAEIESKDGLGQTPLSCAAGRGHEAVVEILLDKGAEVDSKDKARQTPLSWAAENGHEAVVQRLLDKGAEVDSKDKLKWTPLFWALDNGHEVVAKLLLDRGAEVNIKDKDGQTPLSWAAENGREAIVKLLLENGVEVNSKDNDGQTPLSWAVEKRHDAVAKLLRDNGAETNSNDEFSEEPPSLTATNVHGDETIVKLLRDSVAEADSTKDNGQVLIPLAVEN